MIGEALILSAHQIAGGVIVVSLVALILAGIGIVRGERKDSRQVKEWDQSEPDWNWPERPPKWKGYR